MRGLGCFPPFWIRRLFPFCSPLLWWLLYRRIFFLPLFIVSMCVLLFGGRVYIRLFDGCIFVVIFVYFCSLGVLFVFLSYLSFSYLSLCRFVAFWSFVCCSGSLSVLRVFTPARFLWLSVASSFAVSCLVFVELLLLFYSSRPGRPACLILRLLRRVCWPASFVFPLPAGARPGGGSGPPGGWSRGGPALPPSGPGCLLLPSRFPRSF